MDITKIDKEFFWELSALLESKGIKLESVDGDGKDFTVESVDERYVEVTRELVIELHQIKGK